MSLRRTAVLTLSLLLTLVAVAAGVASYHLAGAEAAEFLDLQQRQIARYAGERSFSAPEGANLPPHDPEDDYVVEARAPGGRLLHSSNPAVAIPLATGTGFSEFTDHVGQWRVFSLVTPERFVQVAQRMRVRDELAAEASLRAVLPFALAIPLSWIALGLVASRVFGRLERVADGVAARSAHDTTPIPLEDVPEEMLPLVNAMNSLIARLCAAMQRQRDFLSDAAHELRTPLAALTLQIANVRGASPATDERLSDLEIGIRRASALADQLLRLARYDADVEPAEPVEAFALDELVVEVVASLVVLAEERGIDLGMGNRDRVVVTTRRRDLRVLIEALADNAIRYTPSGGTVDLNVVEASGRAQITVVDSGPGIPDALMPRVFERFFRAAPPEVEGSGLGLSIARAIAHQHGIALELANRTDRSGLIAALVFP